MPKSCAVVQTVSFAGSEQKSRFPYGKNKRQTERRLPKHTKSFLTSCAKTWYNKTLNKIVEIYPISIYMLARPAIECKTKNNIFATPPGVSATNTAERNGVIKAHEGERRTARQNHAKKLCAH
nr:hypothetical protein [uncultured Agathobaculum sp.]